MAELPSASRQSIRFMLLYALAWAGSAIAYTPFLSILLPVRVSLLAGQGGDVAWLAYIAFFGAIAASLGHIGFGYLSDITGNRRVWIGLGLIFSNALLFTISRASDLSSLIVLIAGWQLALNMMLAPLAAWAGDCVPDHQKGLLGGLLAFAPGLGAASGAIVTIPGIASADGRLALVAVIVTCCVVPVLVAGSPMPIAEPALPAEPGAIMAYAQGQADRRATAYRMWFARLAVQVAEAALFAYLYFWLRSLDPAISDNQTARVFGLTLILSAPVTLLAGRWADLRNRPIDPLFVSAAVCAAGLIGMAFARTLPVAISTYALFGLAASVFLALHSAQTLRVLPRSDRRGRDLGLFNLTNTVPSLVMPWITLSLVPYFGFPGLFILLAALALLASFLLRPFNRRI